MPIVDEEYTDVTAFDFWDPDKIQQQKVSIHIMCTIFSCIHYSYIHIEHYPTYFRAEELLLYSLNIIQHTFVQKSYYYTPCIGVCISVHMLNVRVNVKVLESQSVCIFSCILIFCVLLIKPLTTKAHGSRASSGCT